MVYEVVAVLRRKREGDLWDETDKQRSQTALGAAPDGEYLVMINRVPGDASRGVGDE